MKRLHVPVGGFEQAVRDYGGQLGVAMLRHMDDVDGRQYAHSVNLFFAVAARAGMDRHGFRWARF
ncbi:MAG: hypothetical protein VYE77_05140 [Planctomycetota bacterium]|nr:hypothetical protein [Planctomycetota bacterium]